MSEMINIPINVRDLLGKISPDLIVKYYRQYSALGVGEILEEMDSEELIEHLGGIDKLIEDEDNEEAVRDHFDNMNKSDRECAQERY